MIYIFVNRHGDLVLLVRSIENIQSLYCLDERLKHLYVLFRFSFVCDTKQRNFESEFENSSWLFTHSYQIK